MFEEGRVEKKNYDKLRAGPKKNQFLKGPLYCKSRPLYINWCTDYMVVDVLVSHTCSRLFWMNKQTRTIISKMA